MNQKERVDKMAGEAIKTMIEFCINEKIINPKITMNAKTKDGEHYRLVFERLDIDESMSMEDFEDANDERSRDEAIEDIRNGTTIL